MNIDWFQSFLDAANQQSFSKAAHLNNISQPALSKHIKNLENNFGVTLFYRTSTGIRLTEAGEHLYKRITPILSDIANIQGELQQFNQNSPIAIGSLPSIATYFLPNKLKSLTSAHKRTSLMIQNTSNELLESLKEGRLDAVFVDDDYVEKTLWKHKLFTEDYYVVLPSDHKLKSNKTIQLEALLGEPFITHQKPCDTRKRIIEQFHYLGLQPNITNEVEFGDFIFGAITSGTGITIVPQIIAQNIQHLDVCCLPISNFGITRTISLVTTNKKIGSLLYKFIQ